ncbi:MAG: hypothetical protein HC880_08220 [Bacteroidia bacterium]|nr:hypothetical protein [Bacteroidia bacterium]
MKFSSANQLEWAKTYDIPNIIVPSYEVTVLPIPTSEGGFIATGTLSSQNVFVAKLDNQGEIVWIKKFGSDKIYGLEIFEDGSFFVSGQVHSFDHGLSRLLDHRLSKLDANGNILWSKIYGDNGWNGTALVRKDTDGGVILSGWTGTFGLDTDLSLVKLDQDGNLLWRRVYARPNNTNIMWFDAQRVTPLPNGGYLCSGYVTNGNLGLTDILVMKISNSGTLEWSKVYGSNQSDFGVEALVVNDGYIIRGVYKETANSDDKSLY